MADTVLPDEEKDLSRLSDVFITKRMEVHRYVSEQDIEGIQK